MGGGTVRHAAGGLGGTSEEAPGHCIFWWCYTWKCRCGEGGPWLSCLRPSLLIHKLAGAGVDSGEKHKGDERLHRLGARRGNRGMRREAAWGLMTSSCGIASGLHCSRRGCPHPCTPHPLDHTPPPLPALAHQQEGLGLAEGQARLDAELAQDALASDGLANQGGGKAQLGHAPHKQLQQWGRGGQGAGIARGRDAA